MPVKGKKYTQEVLYHSKDHRIKSHVRIVEVVSVTSTFWHAPYKKSRQISEVPDRVRIRNLDYKTEFTLDISDWPLTIKRSGTWIIYKPLEDADNRGTPDR